MFGVKIKNMINQANNPLFCGFDANFLDFKLFSELLFSEQAPHYILNLQNIGHRTSKKRV
jgi:hypothetical protein